MPGDPLRDFFAIFDRLEFYGLTKTLSLLSLSNLFMTFAWYGHLKFFSELPLWKTTLLSWEITLFEYILMVPANRIGFSEEGFSGFRLKILQEIITITVFIGFASLILKEEMKWNPAVS